MEKGNYPFWKLDVISAIRRLETESSHMTMPEYFAIETRQQRHQRLGAAALAQIGGGRSWASFKEQSLQEALAMIALAPRVELLSVDLQGDLQLTYRIDMPTPRWPTADGLVIGRGAIFHLVYLDEWRTTPPPGIGPVGVFHPLDIFHPNAKPALRGALCLGELPAGVAPKELLLMAYYLVALQDYTLDETDPHGVFNPQACEYFRLRPEYLPLCTAGLYEDWQPAGER